MTVNLAFLADPHLCTVVGRKNILELLEREVEKKIDTSSDTSRETTIVNWSWRPSSFDKRPLLAAADILTDLAPEIDLLVLLGDLATTGQEADLEVARRVFLDADTTTFATANHEPRFGGKDIPMLAVPGNHDRYQDDFGTPGGKLFDDVFKKIYKPTGSVSSRTVTNKGASVSLITADFCHLPAATLSIRKRYGWGSVRPAVLNELENQTKEARIAHPKAPVIWALHFSPAEDVHHSIQLEDRELVIELAEKLGVMHIFCGHTHKRNRSIGTYPHIYSSGSVSACDSREKHYLHICSLSEDQDGFSLIIRDLKFDEDANEFVFDPLSDRA